MAAQEEGAAEPQEEARMQLSAEIVAAVTGAWRSRNLGGNIPHWRLARAAGSLGLQVTLDSDALVLRGPSAAGHVAEMEGELATLLSDLEVLEVQEVIPFPQQLFGRFIGRGSFLIRMLQRDLRVGIRPREPNELVVTGRPEDLERAMSRAQGSLPQRLVQFQEAVQSGVRSEIEAQLLEERHDHVHVFMDNSNLWLSAQTSSNGHRDMSIRLNVKTLCQVVIGGRTPMRRDVVGSRPPAQNAIWDRWRQQDFDVQVAHRAADTGREEAVDQLLVAEAMMQMMLWTSPSLRRDGDRPPILVLGTGDGNQRGQPQGVMGASFRNLVITAVSKLGWKVEVWAWRSGCHNIYHRLEQEYPGRIKVCLLDPFRSEVTFRHGVAAAAAAAGADAPTPDTDDAAAAAAAGADEEAENVVHDEEEDLCVVCIDNESTHVLRPCGHKVLCEGCADAYAAPGAYLAGCPICRRGWTSVEPG